MKQWTRSRYLPGLPLGGNGKRATASEEHIRLSRRAAREGMVLLKNEGGALPLAKGEKIALFGKGTVDYVKGGGGSGDVYVPYTVDLAEGFDRLTESGTVFPDTVEFYRSYVGEQYTKGCIPGMIREPALSEALLAKAAAFAQTAVISISRFSGEAWDRLADFDKTPEHKGIDPRPVAWSRELFERGDFYLSDAEQTMVSQVRARFPKVIVVLNTGGVTDTSWFCDDPGIQGALLAWQGGMEGGLAEAELLLGLAEPEGRLADTFAKRLEDYPGSGNYFESDDYVEYSEDIYVGYRFFETIPGAAEKVVYPFGYGLSYTDFELTGRRIDICGHKFTARVNVTNTGNRPGRQVVQVYCCPPQGKLGKPLRQLVGYRKTRMLQPGETQTVLVAFDQRDMASYDDVGAVTRSSWVLENGEYSFYIGEDVRRAEKADQVLRLSEDIVLDQLSERLSPRVAMKRLRSDGSYEELPAGDRPDLPANVLVPLSGAEIEGAEPYVREVPAGCRYRLKTEPQLEQVAEGEVSLKDFVSGLPDEDLAFLLGGQPNTGLANTYGYGNNERFGIPNVMTADGPAGVRFLPETGVKTTAFPCATLLACTWDEEIVELIGEAGGLEAKENNVFAWLTPGVCIHRNPLCGRNFEYYSEDPLLAGRQASAMVKGIQSNHVAATPKHFALNNKESNRKNSDSRVSERAIREIYIRQFEIIVKEAHPWSIMTSYNLINGVHSSESEDLLNGILRGEWGFDGMVTTDWWTFGEHYREALAGNDMKMGCGYPFRLLEALKKGAITREAMEKAAEHVLTLILRVDK